MSTEIRSGGVGFLNRLVDVGPTLDVEYRRSPRREERRRAEFLPFGLASLHFMPGGRPDDERFVRESAAAGLDGLKGHRSVGGMRASIYNAFPEEGVDALVAFMRDFERKHG